MPLERVQKILAQVGVASRRKAEELIRLGEVTINGKVAKLGDKAEFGVDAIKVSGKLLHTQQNKVYYAFYKPRAVISMMEDPRERPCIADYTRKIKERLFPVGRMDFMSEGLIILTNDGDFVAQYSKREDIPRVYHVRVKGDPDAEMLLRIERGMRIEDKRVRPQSVRIKERLTQKAYVEVVMLGSGAQDIRVLFESRGFLVDKMIRVSIGQVTLHGMNPGELRQLKDTQVKAILDQPELGMRMIENIQTKDKPRTPEEMPTHLRPEQPIIKKKRKFPKGPHGESGGERVRRETPIKPRGASTSSFAPTASAWDEKPKRDARPGSRPARPARAGARPAKKSFGDKPKGRAGARSDSRPTSPRSGASRSKRPAKR